MEEFGDCFWLFYIGILSMIMIICIIFAITIICFIIRVTKMYYKKALSDFKTKYNMNDYDDEDYDW